MTLGEKLRTLREARGETQRDTARACRIAPSHLCDLEQDRRALPAALAGRLSAHFALAPDVLEVWAGRVPVPLRAALLALDAAEVAGEIGCWYAQVDRLLLQGV